MFLMTTNQLVFSSRIIKLVRIGARLTWRIKKGVTEMIISQPDVRQFEGSMTSY